MSIMIFLFFWYTNTKDMQHCAEATHELGDDHHHIDEMIHG